MRWSRNLLPLRIALPGAEPTDPKHGHAFMRLGIWPAEAAVNRVTGAEYRGCLLVANLVRDQIRGVGISMYSA